MFYSCISFTKKKYIAPCAWLAHFVECVRYQHTAHICGEYVCDRERHTIVIRRRKFNETNRQRSHENAQLWDQPRLSQHNTASHRSTATKPFIVTTEERCITVCDRLRLIAVGAWISPGTNVCFYHSRAAFKHIAFCFCNFSFRFVFVLLSLCLCQPKPPGQSVCCIWFSFFSEFDNERNDFYSNPKWATGIIIICMMCSCFSFLLLCRFRVVRSSESDSSGATTLITKICILLALAVCLFTTNIAIWIARRKEKKRSAPFGCACILVWCLLCWGHARVWCKVEQFNFSLLLLLVVLCKACTHTNWYEFNSFGCVVR